MTKSTFNFLLPLLCLILCLLFPSACSAGVSRGLRLSLEAALPALYPSLVLSCLLVKNAKSGGKKSFLIPFFLGLFCGFPVGAKAVADLVSAGKITKKDGEKLLFFCNNAGPAFLISYCGETVLGSRAQGIFLFLLQSALSAIFLLIFFGKRLFAHEKKGEKKREFSQPFWKSIPFSLREAANSFIYIMSCVIFFSFLLELFRELFELRQSAFSFLGVFCELCGGVYNLKSLSPSLAFPLCAFACGWGGLSVHLQTAGVLESTQIQARKHFAGKIIFSLILGFSALFLQKLL